MKIQLKASPSGCWHVIRNGTSVEVRSPSMWRQALDEAIRESVMNEIPRSRGWI